MATSNTTQSKQNTTENNSQLARAAKESYQVFTGTVERVIRWHRNNPAFRYYEVIASVIGLQEGNVRLEKIMLLRDRIGPVLQVQYYIEDRINITDFSVGQMLRCVGRMVGPNILQAISIRAAMPDEVSNLQRLCYICDHSASSMNC